MTEVDVRRQQGELMSKVNQVIHHFERLNSRVIGSYPRVS